MTETLRYYDISWCSTTDGPGSRVVLFLRKCNLRCPWCHAPHSWDDEPSLLFFQSRCLYCGICETICPNQVHTVREGTHTLDRRECRKCGLCVESCPTTISRDGLSGALALPSVDAEPARLFKRLEAQLELLRRIGGLTVSGGEPLLQYHALRSLLVMCKQEGYHTAIETSGAVPRENFSRLVDVVDHWLFGLRPVANGRDHPHLAEQMNVSAGNLAFLVSHVPDRITIRLPVIPTLTDSDRGLSMIAEIMTTHKLGAIELLPYNPHSAHYYESLGLDYMLDDLSPPSETELGRISEVFCDNGISARIVR